MGGSHAHSGREIEWHEDRWWGVSMVWHSHHLSLLMHEILQRSPSLTRAINIRPDIRWQSCHLSTNFNSSLILSSPDIEFQIWLMSCPSNNMLLLTLCINGLCQLNLIIFYYFNNNIYRWTISQVVNAGMSKWIVTNTHTHSLSHPAWRQISSVWNFFEIGIPSWLLFDVVYPLWSKPIFVAGHFRKIRFCPSILTSKPKGTYEQTPEKEKTLQTE